jgi:PAS domain S-box-containing protein
MPVKRHTVPTKARRENRKRRPRRDHKITASAGRVARESIRADMKKVKAAPRVSRELSTNGEVGKAGATKRSASGPVLRHPKTELEAAVQRYVDLFEFAPIAYVSFNRVGRIEESNLVAAQLLGRSRDRLIGQPFALHVAKKDGALFLNHLFRCRASESRVETELYLKKQNGEIILAHLASSPMTSSMRDGALLYQTAIIDLTERKRAEEAIRHSEKRYRTLFDLVPVAVYTCDAKGLIQEYNQLAVDLWGREPKTNSRSEKFCGSWKIFHPDGRPMRHKDCPMARVLRGEELQGDELEILIEQSTGARRNVLVSPTALKNGQGKIIGAINCLHDISMRKRAEDVRSEALRQRAALYELSQRHQEAKTLDEMYAAALDAILTALPCDRASILLYDHQQVMRFVAWRGLSKKYRKAVEGHSPWKPGAKSPKPVCINDVDIADIPRPLKSTIRTEGIRAVAFIPLVSSRTLIGKFMTYYNAPHEFTNNELKLATTIARQLVQAIQHRRDEEALRESEERLRAIVQEANAGMARYDEKSHIEFVNSRFCKMLGYKESELIGKTVREITYPDDLETTSQALKRVLRKGEPTEIDKRYLRKDGSIVWVNVCDAPERDAAGRPKSVVAVAVDITARRKAEEALREKEAELELMVTQTPFMLTRCTRDLRYRYASRAYADLVGRRPEEIAGKSIVEIVGKEGLKKILPYIEKVLKGHMTEYEMEVPFRGVGVHWLHSVYTPDRDAEGNVVGWFASLANVGRRKEAEALLQRSKELLEERVLERTRELHLANKELKAEIVRRKGLEGEILEISDREQQRLAQELHDGLCQHLTAVAFMARSVALRLKNHRVIEVKDIEKIAELVNNAATDTRNLSRALHRVDVDAAGLVGALEDLVDREMWRTPCRLEVKPSFHLDDDTVAAHLYRIAREAVINANKHAQAREVVVALKGWRKGIVLSVTDDGIGFQNAQNGARGLGFHIMNYRARVMGGQLKIESPEKGGTHVACYLPNETLKSHKRRKRGPERLSAKLTKALSVLI